MKCLTGLGESLHPLTTKSHIMPRATQMATTDTRDGTDAQRLYFRQARFPLWNHFKLSARL